MTLAIIGNVGPSSAEEKWVRNAFGLAHAADLDMLIGDNIADSVIVVGRDTAEVHGMQSFGLDKTVPLAGHQWRALVDHVAGHVRTLYTFCPSPASLASLPDGTTARPSLRRVLMAEMVLGLPNLRPWHFRLSDRQTLHDLGVAWCPASPSAGMAFALYAAEAHRAHAAASSSPLSRAVHAAFPAVAEYQRDHLRRPGWDAPMRTVAAMALGPNPAATIAAHFGVTRTAVESLLPRCPPLTAHDAARGILMRHMMEFA